MPSIINILKKEIIIYCPLCNGSYSPRDIATIEQTGNVALIHSKCPKCAGSVLSLLYKDLLGITLLGMATDMDFNDALRLKDADYINEDDVLEIYQMLNPVDLNNRAESIKPIGQSWNL